MKQSSRGADVVFLYLGGIGQAEHFHRLLQRSDHRAAESENTALVQIAHHHRITFLEQYRRQGDQQKLARQHSDQHRFVAVAAARVVDMQLVAELDREPHSLRSGTVAVHDLPVLFFVEPPLIPDARFTAAPIIDVAPFTLARRGAPGGDAALAAAGRLTHRNEHVTMHSTNAGAHHAG